MRKHITSIRLSKTILTLGAFFLFANRSIANNISAKSNLSKTKISFPCLHFTSKDSNSFTLPFSMAGNLIIIKAKVDNTEGSFILDSGCPGLVLNLTYFRDYPRTIDADDDTKGITGNIGYIEHTTVKELNFGFKTEFDIKADLIGLGHIENKKGIKILGLIGMQFIDDGEIIIDYEKSIIYFHKIAKFEEKTYKHKMLADTSLYSVINFEVVDNRIIVKSEIAGKILRLIIDCAAETNVLNTKLPNVVFDNLTINGSVLLTGASNSKVEAIKGDIKDFKIGNKTITNLPFIVANLEKTCFAYGGCVDGILGFDFLGLQKIGFNFVKHQMYLWK